MSEWVSESVSQSFIHSVSQSVSRIHFEMCVNGNISFKVDMHQVTYCLHRMKETEIWSLWLNCYNDNFRNSQWIIFLFICILQVLLPKLGQTVIIHFTGKYMPGGEQVECTYIDGSTQSRRHPKDLVVELHLFCIEWNIFYNHILCHADNLVTCA